MAVARVVRVRGFSPSETGVGATLLEDPPVLIWLKRGLVGLMASCVGLLTVADLPGEDEADDDSDRTVAARCALEGRAPGPHEFFGRHLLASYTHCDHRALRSIPGLRAAVARAVDNCGATRLNSVEHVFPPDGVTIVVLLAESHASIHTYPEHDACFVDLFTCGRACSAERFERTLRSYLRPRSADCRLIIRDRSNHTEKIHV